ncbi:MAG: DUF4468 domain-containing protein [Bacteroidaceae bacterium]|nr:DUF4468 domain-containing protein [Bacteroidaceae bacterium]
MKKLFLMLTFFVSAMNVSAQLMRAEELEKYAENLYGNKWVDIAANLKNDATLTLDKNNSLTFIQVIEAPGRSVSQLYTTMNYWFTVTFNDAYSTIKLNDKELGCIIAQGSVEGVATHTGGSNKYNVSIRPIIRVDIKDGKCRVTYSLGAYNVLKSAGGGILGQIAAGMNGTKVKTTEINETWPLDQTYPFAEKDAFGAKKTSSKSLIMSYSYSQIIMDKIEEAIKNGMVGEDDNW